MADTDARPDSPIVDFACHVYPSSAVEESRKEGALWSLLDGMPYDPEAALSRLREAGVDRAVLSAPTYQGEFGPERAAVANDALLDVADAEDRFYALATLPTASGGEAAAAEFERCLDRGFNGAVVSTRSEGVRLTDPELEPVFEVADGTQAPVLVHPELHDSLAPGALDDTYFYNAVYGREVALCVAISNVINKGLLDRYPDARLVFHHQGGNIGSMLGRVFVHTDRSRWPFKTELLPYEEFASALRRVYVDTAGHHDNRHALAATLDAFPASHVLFGTDTPYEVRSVEDVEHYIAAVEDVAAPADVEGILGGNALDLLVNVD